MLKKTSLTKALQQTSQQSDIQESIHTDMSDFQQPHIQGNARQDKKIISGHFDPSVAYRIKRLALEREKSVQALLGEALADLFHKYSAPVKE